MIMDDHREVERLFDRLLNEPENRPLVLPTVTALLIAHSRAEEAEVYPAARDEAGEADDVAHSQSEHVEAEEILAKLAGMDAADPQYDATVRELVDAVKHHVEEEESKVLPGMRQNLTADRLEDLGQAFARERQAHLGEEPEDLTRDELLIQATNAEIEGAASMSKSELQRALKQKAEESE